MIEHGITTENAWIHAHVGFLARVCFVFSAESGIKAIESGRYRERTATQPGVGGMETARGYAVPYMEIEGLRAVPFREHFLKGISISERSSTSEKGRAARELVRRLLLTGMFPLKVRAGNVRIGTKDEDIAGIDLIITGDHTVQVKCDWKAGPRYQGGTGNIFIQTAELNPLKAR